MSTQASPEELLKLREDLFQDAKFFAGKVYGRMLMGYVQTLDTYLNNLHPDAKESDYVRPER